MFYIDYVDKENFKYSDNINKLINKNRFISFILNNKLIKNYIYFCKRFFKGIDIEYIGEINKNLMTHADNLSFEVKINIYKVNKKIIKRLERINNILLENKVLISNKIDKLKGKEIVLEVLEEKGIEVLNKQSNKNKLFKIMTFEILNKLEESYSIPLNKLLVGIFINEITNSFLYDLEKIILKVKNVVIITRKEFLLDKYKDDLYYKYGVILNINNKEMFLKSDVILNYDYKENNFSNTLKDRKKDTLYFSRTIFINLGEKDLNDLNIKFIDSCILINDFKVSFINKEKINFKYFEYIKKLENFKFENIYENLIFKNSNIKKIKKEITEDGLYIKHFYGMRGKISRKEFVNFRKCFENKKEILNFYKK